MNFWLNGSLENNTKAIHINERGFLLGDGVFETFYVHKGIVAFCDDHIMRLNKGLGALKIAADIPSDFGEIVRALIKKSGLQQKSAAARITVTRGQSERGLGVSLAECAPTILITVREVPQIHKAMNTLVNLKISQFHRSEKSIIARHKTLNYLENILAHNEAQDMGADVAIMLNGAGRVACAPTANVYVLDAQGTVHTPHVEEGALPGIIRGKLLQSSSTTGVEICEASINLALLRSGDIFLSNSLTGLRAAKINGNSNAWLPQACNIFQRLQAWYDGCLSDDLAERELK